MKNCKFENINIIPASNKYFGKIIGGVKILNFEITNLYIEIYENNKLITKLSRDKIDQNPKSKLEKAFYNYLL